MRIYIYIISNHSVKSLPMAQESALPSYQARSRASSARLLKAAIEILGQQGLENATIPRIAQRAGLTPGSVYRRFHDKEALLETAILQVLEQQEETMKTSPAPLATSQIPLPLFAEQLIGGMVAAYRTHAGLLQSMRQFVQNRKHTAFWRRATALEARHFKRAVGLFLSYRDEIRHSKPREAISLALMMMAGTLYQVVVCPGDPGRLKDLLPAGDQALKRELTRAFLSYLGVRIEPNRPAATIKPSRAIPAKSK
jgi:AcrR family transcriptional regulator